MSEYHTGLYSFFVLEKFLYSLDGLNCSEYTAGAVAQLWESVIKCLLLKQFLPARRYASAGLCDSDVSGRPSVCPSVRHTPALCLAERKQDREMYTIW